MMWRKKRRPSAPLPEEQTGWDEDSGLLYDSSAEDESSLLYSSLAEDEPVPPAGRRRRAKNRSAARRKGAAILTGLAVLLLLLGFFAVRRLVSGTPVSPAVAGALEAEENAASNSSGDSQTGSSGSSYSSGGSQEGSSGSSNSSGGSQTGESDASSSPGGSQTEEKALATLDDATGDLTVRYLDVGQGMAALIECGGHYMAIDGGGRASSSKFVAVLKACGIEKLDYIIVSHYDDDHLAGLIGALHVFPTDLVLAPDYEADTAIYRSYKEMLTEEDVPELVPSPGDIYPFGTAAFQIVGPGTWSAELENDRSIMVLLTNGTHRFLFPGDAETAEEADVLAGGLSLKADVLSSPHHGSKTSNTDAFLDAVSPQIAIVSAGADNKYHHPHPSVLRRYEKRGIQVYRTDESGTITVTSQGGELTVSTEK